MNLVFPVERWFAWHPVRTCDMSWQWRRTIFRRQVVDLTGKKFRWQYFYNDPMPRMMREVDRTWMRGPDGVKPLEKTVH